MVGFIRGGGSGGSGNLDTTDATALPEDVRLDKSFYAGGEKRFGNMPEKGATIITPGKENIEIPGGRYLTGAQTILGDTALLSGNIKKDVVIFGVHGSDNVVDTSLSSGAMASAQLLSGYSGFVNGSKVSGSMTDKSGSSQSASASTASSRLYLSLPANGYYNTLAKLYVSYSNLASLLGISGSKIVEGYTICGVSGTHTCPEQQPSSAITAYYTSVSGSTSKTISCGFTPRAVAWLLSTSSSGSIPSVSNSQARIAGWCDEYEDGYLTSVRIDNGNTFTKALSAGSDVEFYGSSVYLNDVMTSGNTYRVLVIGEE